MLQQDLWGGRVTTARPATVVQDQPNYLALYTHPNAPYRSNAIRDRYSMPVAQRVDPWVRLDLPPIEERVSGAYQALTLTPPDVWYSVWLFWDLKWRVLNWFVNFQSPIRRTSRGILVQDHALDIKVDPDLSWSWKDEDEYEELARRGWFTEEQKTSIWAEADYMVRAIEENGPPFSDGWEDWRPDPTWPVPMLPDDWEVLDG